MNNSHTQAGTALFHLLFPIVEAEQRQLDIIESREKRSKE